MKHIISLAKKYPVLMIILLVQVCLIVYFNLFEHQNYLGFDASVHYLQVIESWKQKSLLLDNWVGQTTLALDSQIPLATLIYGITKNVFLAMGLSNIIITGFFIFVLYMFIKVLKINGIGAILFFSLILTPFIARVEISNNLDYFFMMYFGCGAYLFRTAICFLIYYVYYKFFICEYGKLEIVAAVLCVSLSLISAVSSGLFVLIFGVAPLVLHWFVCLIQEGKLNKDKRKSIYFLFILLIASLLGKMATEYFLDFEIRDSLAVWVSLSQFWSNLGSIFTGYLAFIGALPLDEGVNILSTRGIGFCFGILVAISLLIGVALTIRHTFQRKDSSKPQFILVCILIGHLTVFTLCYTTYGSPIFELRYLIIGFIILSLLFTKWVDSFLCYNKNRLIKSLLHLCVCCGLIGINLYSYYYVYQCRSDYNTATQIVDQIHEYESPVVYVPGSDLVVLARNLRVIDPTRVYKASYDMGNLVNAYHWGDYTYYDDTGDYSGPTIMLCTDEFYNALPDYLMKQYDLQEKIENTNIGLYTSPNNPVDMQTGIVDEKNTDYFYSQGISTYANGYFDEYGSFVTDGTEGFATWGPYAAVPEGTYQFILHYEVLSNPNQLQQVGAFDVTIDTQRIAVVPMNSGEQSVVLEVNFDNYSQTSKLEYRTYVTNGVQLKLNYIEINGIETDTGGRD